MMRSGLIEQIAIREESIVREEIASHPLFKDVQALVHVDRASSYENELKNQLRRGMELSRRSHAKLFELCDRATTSLGLDVNARLFKSRDGGGVENAFVMDRGQDILVVFQDGILAALDDDNTLLGAIGHELGHVLFGHTTDVISWSIVGLDSQIAAMDEGDKPPAPLAKELQRLRRDAGWDELVVLHHLLRQIGELSADRAGLLCVPDFEACVRGAMILSGGPADRFGTYNPPDFLSQARRLIETGDIFDETDWFLSHPLQPLRVLALEFFSNSDVYRELTGRGSGKNRVSDFSKLLPSIVPTEILGRHVEVDERPRTKPGATHARPSQAGASDAMTELEINTLSYMCMANIIGADGKITAGERTFLEQQIRPIAALEAVHRALDALTDGALATELDRLLGKANELTARAKGALVKRMIKAAKADRRVTQEEIDRIRELAGSMGAAEQAEREIANVWGR